MAPPPELALPGARWGRVSRSNPCPVCSKPDGCLVSPDGATAVCLRIASSSPVPAQRGLGGWYHPLTDRPRPLSLPDRPLLARPLASLADRHRVYQALIDELGLNLAHRRHLTEKRRITLPQAQARGYASLPPNDERRRAVTQRLQDRFGEDLLLSVPGFVRVRGRLTLAGPTGILIPVRSPQGWIQAFQIRRDHERTSKYVWFSSAAYHGPSSGALCHTAGPLQGSASPRVWLTEGPLKADLAAQLLVERVVAIPGVGSSKDLPAALHALQTSLSDELEVIVALDADWQTKPQVAQARARIAESLAQAGWAVHLADWSLQEAKGLDDLLQRGLTPELTPYRAHTCGPRLLEARAPAPSPPKPEWTVEKLRRELPRTLDRALKSGSGTPAALLVKTPPGTGKTHALTEALNRMAATTRKHAAVFVPRHALAEGEGRDRWTHVYGRARPMENGARPCAFSERMDRIHRLRLSASEACQACPLLQTCRDNADRAGSEPWYWAQFAHLGRVSVFPAEHLLVPDFWSGASVVVLDDVDLRQLLLEKVTVTLEDCRQTLELLDRPEYQNLQPAQPLLALTADWLHYRDRDAPPRPLSSDQWLDEWVRWVSDHRIQLTEAVEQALQAAEPELFQGKDLRQVELARPKRFILDLARVLRHELAQLASGRHWNPRLVLRKHDGHLVLDLHLRRDLARPAFAHKTLIVLNASASRDDLEELFPDRAWEVFEPEVAVPDGVEVIQMADRNYGKTHLLELQDGYRQLKTDLEFLARSHRERGHRMGAITHMAFESTLRDLVPDLAVTGHYFGQRGSNDFEDCQALFVVGTPWPNPQDLLQQARTLYWDGPAIQPTERLKKRRLGRNARGQDLWTSVRTYADPRLQRLLEARREEELFQAVGRARIFNLDTSPGRQLALFESGETERAQRQRVRVYVLSGLPLRLGNVEIRSERVLEDARLQSAAAEFQAQGLPLSRRLLAGAARTSERQAEHWLNRWRGQGSPSLVDRSDPVDPRVSSRLPRSPRDSSESHRGSSKADAQRLSKIDRGGLDRVHKEESDSKRSSSPESPSQTQSSSSGSLPRYEEKPVNTGISISQVSSEVDRPDPVGEQGSQMGHREPPKRFRPPECPSQTQSPSSESCPRCESSQKSSEFDSRRSLGQEVALVAARLHGQGLRVSRRRLAREAGVSERQAAKCLRSASIPLPAPEPLAVQRERLAQAMLELDRQGLPVSRRRLARAALTSERQARNWLKFVLLREAG